MESKLVVATLVAMMRLAELTKVLGLHASKELAVQHGMRSCEYDATSERHTHDAYPQVLHWLQVSLTDQATFVNGLSALQLLERECIES